ncbi:hypothetical protein GBA63_01530 [Rubrobacter tropicus]|uniref:Uncharacterized protein n=1 Tax=Rubrobacter tropicus TaxID=2653851 RepID=A0A6G8Q4P7_9ACTN|nr:hypothetical protein [Rubrobacter tropicus]QIN81452.1 hypothetical protein GBA63_01530 [Rubrobacter tropicus]
MSDYTEKIQVRQVTDIHSNWSEQGDEAPGKFSFQLVLDNGAEERVIRPTSEDADVLMDLFAAGESLYFDLGRGVLLFRDIT